MNLESTHNSVKKIREIRKCNKHKQRPTVKFNGWTSLDLTRCDRMRRLSVHIYVCFSFPEPSSHPHSCSSIQHPVLSASRPKHRPNNRTRQLPHRVDLLTGCTSPTTEGDGAPVNEILPRLECIPGLQSSVPSLPHSAGDWTKSWSGIASYTTYYKALINLLILSYINRKSPTPYIYNYVVL